MVYIMDTTFQFTRHLPSCNNIFAGKLMGKDFEPSGSFYGIKKAIGYANEHRPRFISSNVCVSNLIRTWVTATLLYGTGDAKKLYLHVYPHLKEKVKGVGLGFSIVRGNYPKPINHMISKFKLFLIKLMMIRRDYKITDFNLSTEIHLIIPGTTFQFVFKGLLEYEVIIMPTQLQTRLKPIRCQHTNIYDTTGPNTDLVGYKEDGDLEKFMEYYNDKGQAIKGDVVHVVTHSATMKSYLKSIGFVNPTTYEDIIKTNLWSFKTHQRNFNEDVLKVRRPKTPLDLFKGVELNIDEAQKEERDMVKYSLCGDEGSIKPLCDPLEALPGPLMNLLPAWGTRQVLRGTRQAAGTNRQRRLKKTINKTHKKRRLNKTRRWGKRTASY